MVPSTRDSNDGLAGSGDGDVLKASRLDARERSLCELGAGSGELPLQSHAARDLAHVCVDWGIYRLYVPNGQQCEVQPSKSARRVGDFRERLLLPDGGRCVHAAASLRAPSTCVSSKRHQAIIHPTLQLYHHNPTLCLSHRLDLHKSHISLSQPTWTSTQSQTCWPISVTPPPKTSSTTFCNSKIYGSASFGTS